MRTEGLDGALNLFINDKLEAMAGLKPRLLSDVQKVPGARILDGNFTAVQQAIGTAKTNEAGATFLRSFVEVAKKSGLKPSLLSDVQKVPGARILDGNF